MRETHPGLYDANANGWLERDDRKFLLRCLRCLGGVTMTPGSGHQCVSQLHLVAATQVAARELDGSRGDAVAADNPAPEPMRLPVLDRFAERTLDRGLEFAVGAIRDVLAVRVQGSGERWRIEGEWRADRQLCNDYLGYLADRRYSPASVRTTGWMAVPRCRRGRTTTRRCSGSALPSCLLLAGEERTIGKDGIRLRGLAYVAPELQGRDGQKVQVRYMPHDDRLVEVYLGTAHLCTAYPQGQLTPESRRRRLLGSAVS